MHNLICTWKILIFIVKKKKRHIFDIYSVFVECTLSTFESCLFEMNVPERKMKTIVIISIICVCVGAMIMIQIFLKNYPHLA